MATKLTADELLEIARREKPHVKYTKNRNGNAIAAHHEGRWQTVAMMTLLGDWCSVGDLYINGVPANNPTDWIE